VVKRVPTSVGRVFCWGQEALIALRDVNSLISLFNQRKASNFCQSLHRHSVSVIIFLSNLSGSTSPRHRIGRGGQIAINSCYQTRSSIGWGAFFVGARTADSAERSELADVSVQSAQRGQPSIQQLR